MNLYNISQEYLVLINELEEQEGVLSPEQEQLLALNEQNFKENAIRRAYVLKHIKSDISTIDAEIDRLKGLKTSKTKVYDRIEDSLIQGMTLYGKDGIDGGTIKLAITKSKFVDVIDEASVPAEYMREKVTLSVDKTEIAKVLKAGGEVNGCVLGERDNLQIK